MKVLLILAVLLVLFAVVAIGRGVSWVMYQRNHPSPDNQFLSFFLPPKSPDASRYFTDPKIAAFANHVRNGNAKAVRRALADGIDVNAAGNQGFRPIFFALYPKKDATVLKLLLVAGAKPNVRLANGDTPLHTAVLLPTTDHAAALLAAGADANARGENDKPVLTVIVYAERDDMLRLLAKHHADLDLIWAGTTPLLSAEITSAWTTAATLLELGADFQYKDRLGRDAVSYFCKEISTRSPVPKNRVGIPALARAFAARGVELPCAREVDRFR